MKFKGIRDVILDSNGNVSYPKNVHPKVNFKVKVDASKAEKLSTNSTFTSVRANYKNGDSKIFKKISIGDEESFEVWGCQEYFDIYDLCEKLNNEDKKEKNHQTAILKGNYHGGTTGKHCKQGANYLFFDIDIKQGKENAHLYSNPVARAKLFKIIKEHAVFAWRSSSGTGIAGVLYVPWLAGIKDTKEHLAIGNAITDHFEELIKQDGIEVKFDHAQNKFRQIRYLAYQEEEIKINKNPTSFNFQIEQEQAFINNSPDFEDKENWVQEGSIRDQFNIKHPIRETLIQCGFENKGAARYKHHKTTSISSGVVIGSVFFNHSESFSYKSVFDSFALVAESKSMTDYEFTQYLHSQGYDHKHINQDKLRIVAKQAKTERAIWEICKSIKDLSYSKRKQWLDSCELAPELKIHFENYLYLKHLEIDYDEYLQIKEYVKEQIGEVFNYADKKLKIIVCADTGTGKSTAIIAGFAALRPNKRLLFIAPLTVIVDQFRNKGYPCLTGKDSEKEHAKALTAPLVIATQEQAIRHLEHNKFDYVVLDEIHSSILANSFKSETISSLISGLTNETIIGLTGTPHQFFKGLGYKLLKIEKSTSPMKVLQRKDNRNAAKIILQHQENVKGRAIYRINSKQTIGMVVAELKERGYKDEEIAIFESSLEVKLGDDYKGLVTSEKFGETVKIVLTTSLIDEGVSIRDVMFTDVVFVDNFYHPRPEPLKQFLNRFRNKDKKRKYYHYLRVGDNQSLKGFKNTFESDKKRLEKLDKKSSYGAMGSDDEFINSDGEINEYYLAFVISQKFFASLNRDEFNEFLKINYNLDIEVDYEYSTNIVEIIREKVDVKQQISDLLINEIDEVMAVVKVHTQDKKLKRKLNAGMRGVNEPFIKSHIGKFESHIKYIHSFEKLEADPNKFMFVDGLLDNPQNIATKLEILKMQKALVNTVTARDKKLKAKYEKFLIYLRNADSLDKNKVFNAWVKIVAVQRPKLYVLNHFIAINSNWFYDGKKSIYVNKDKSPKRWHNHYKSWYTIMPHNDEQLKMFEGES